MALDVEKGTFTKTTTTGTSSQQVNLSNSSLTPKIIILHTTGHTAFDAYTDDTRISYGYSDGTTSNCQAYVLDESLRVERYTWRTDAIICLIDLASNAIVSQGTISGVAAGSFTINWSVQTDTNALNIHYEVIGGSDITNVSIINVAIGDGSTGNHSYTGSGASWTPDFALTMSSNEGAAGIDTLIASGDRSIFCIGAAKSTTQQWVAYCRDETFTTSDTDMYLNPSACLAACSTTAGTVTFLANFVSFDNAAGGGITVNVTDAATQSLQRIGFLLVKGGLWDCGAFQQRSGTGTQDVTYTDAHVDTSMVFLAGINSASSATVVNNAYFGIGASDGTNEGASWWGNQNGLGTFTSSHIDSNTKTFWQATPASTATSSTTNAACDMSDITINGKFTLNWTTADTTLRRMAWWAVGVSGPGNFARSPSTDNVAVSENLLGYKPGPAMVKFGTITKDTTTGVHTQNFTNELGFRPKGMIFWGTGQTATGGAANARFGIGMTADNASGDWGYMGAQADASATASSQTTTQSSPSDCIIICDSTGATELVTARVNFQNNGFDVVYAAADAVQYKINYFAFTAPNIANIYCGTQTIPAGTGNWNITAPGFTGTIAFFGGGSLGANASTGAMPVPAFGVAMNNSKQWAVCSAADNVNTTNNARRQRTDRCLQSINTVSGFPATAAEISFTDWLSNGLSVNVIATDNDDIQLMVVRGGDWDLGALSQPTSTGNQVVDTDPEDLNTKGVLFCSFNNTATTSAVDHHRFTLGGGDGTNECCSWIGSTDNVTTTVAKCDHSESKSIRMLTEASGGSTVDAEADLTSIGTAGEFTLNWPDVDATAREVCWLVCGDRFSQGTTFERSPSADSTTVSDGSTTRILTANRAPSSDSTTVSDSSLTRTLQAFRSPSSDSVATTEDVQRSKTWPRIPSADTTTVSDVSTTRRLSALRVPSTEVVTPTDSSLTRILSASRNPSSDSVTTSENLTGGKLLERSPSTDSITVADSSLTRLLSALRLPSSDSITTGENLTRILSAMRSPSTDSITAQDSSTTQSITRVRAPSTDSTVVSDISVTRLLQLFRTLTTETITVADGSLTRILSLLRVPSSDSVGTSENITAEKTQGAQTYERSPTAETVNIVDSSLTRILSALRLPSTETVTVQDSSLTRLLQLFRSPSTDTIITNDNATRIETVSRAPASDSITVIDSSLTRMLSALRLPSVEVISATDSSLTRILSAVRVPSTEIVTTGESLGAQVSGRISRSLEESVDVSENLTRILSARRVPTADTVNLNEQLSRIITRIRLPSSDSVVVAETSLTRSVARVRSISEAPGVVEASLSRVLSASRSLNDTTVVSEVQGQISLSRRLEETIAVTEPVIQRIVTAIRATTPDIVEVSEQVFYQALHKFVFDSVSVAEQLFSERESLGGSMSYATPAEVRPLLGNIGTQRTDAQITLAIDSAYDEINRRTNRQPPNDWKDTENDFGIVKKICRFKAALEMAIGIKDFEDREWMQKEIEEMFTIIEEHDPGGAGSNDIVGSSPDETYALNPAGIIWSTRYPNLKKGSTGENDTTINPAT